MDINLIWQNLGIPERPQQKQLINYWNELSEDHGAVLVEAGTGTGKSFPLIIEAISKSLKTKMPTIISSGTNALVDQYYTKDVPRIVHAWNEANKDIDGAPSIRYAMIKGRRNYLCLSRLSDALDSGIISRETHDIIVDSGAEHEGVLSQMPLFEVPEEWISVAQKEDCKCDGTCWYDKAKLKMANAQVVITNHKYIALDAFLSLQTDGNVQLLPPYKFLFVDEIHTFEPYVRDTLGFQIINSSCAKAFRKVGGREIHDKINGISNALFSMLPKTKEKDKDKDREKSLEPSELKDIRRYVVELIETMGSECKIFLQEALDEQDRISINRKLNPVYNRINQLKILLEVCDDKENVINNLATWDGKRIFVRPVRIDEFCSLAVWKGIKVLGVSATIPESLPSRIGLKGIDVHSVGSPFDYDDQAKLWISPVAKKRSNFWKDQEGLNKWLKERCREIWRLVKASNGSALLLFTSYQDLDDHLGILEKPFTDMGIKVLRQGATAGENMRIGAEFKSDVHSVLFGVDTFGTGFDAPGDTLKLVIIANVPWGVPNDPLKLKMEEIEEWGKQYYSDEMLLKLAQWGGRLIRTAEDRGVIAILNKTAGRFVRRERVLSYMDDMERVDIEEAIEFLKNLN